MRSDPGGIAAKLPVVDLGTDPASFISRIEAGHWFDVQALGAADFARGASYQARAKVEAALADVTDIQSFLSGLQMRSVVSRSTGSGVDRLVQLERKTNQFNVVMTPRLDEAAVKSFAARSDAVVLAATLTDKFGDHGIVSSLIASERDDDLVIESWVMSCRVFSRTLEQCMMRIVIDEARSRGLRRVFGQYVASDKNGVVADLYERLGFTELEAQRSWARPVDLPVDDLVTLVRVESAS